MFQLTTKASKVFLLLLVFFAFCLAAYKGIPIPQETPPSTETACRTEPSSEETVTSSPTETAPTDPPDTTAPWEEETEPAHSRLYIEGLDVEDVILYFNEVCLDAEFVLEGNAQLLQKWTVPIHYIILGDPTDQDLQVLRSFTAWLNTIEGFPGIYETQDHLTANLRIHFTTQQDMLDLMGETYTGLDGAVTFWYDDNVIYDAIICCRTDLGQTLRNSVIMEEVYNGLGPVQDTALRPDSIIYSEFSEPQQLTDVDELILKLLYHPQMQCGMDAEDCASVIRQLYY